MPRLSREEEERNNEEIERILKILHGEKEAAKMVTPAFRLDPKDRGVVWDDPVPKSELWALADKSPKEDHTMLKNWQLHDAMLDARIPRLLSWGPPGIGKSYGPAKWAKTHGFDFLSITLTDQTPMSELRGHFILKGHDFVWHDGVIARAWRRSAEKPVLLEINEIVEAGADTEVFLHNALDDPEFARLDLPNGDTLRPTARNLITVATMNGKPEHLREALRDRFPVKIHVAEPHPDAIAALPRDLRSLATEMTKEGKEDRLSIRPFVAFAAMREAMDPMIAAQAVFGASARDLMASLGIAATTK